MNSIADNATLTSPQDSKDLGWLYWWPAGLIVSVLILLPFSRLSAVPVAVMMLAGIVLMFRVSAQFWQRPSVRLFLGLLLAFVLPSLFSCFDAVQPARSWQSSLAFLRFLPVGLFVIYHLADSRQRLALWRIVSALVVFWCIDALIQVSLGRNLLGMPMSTDRLNGLFGQTNIKLGHVLAVLAPIPLEYARRFLPKAVLWAVLGLLLAVIVLVSTRAAWIMFGLVLLAYVYLYAKGRPRRWLKAGVILMTVASATLVMGYHLSPSLAERFDRSLLVLEGDADSVDRALGWRLPIWRTSLSMIAAHPVNGVGTRGFRYAYPEFAQDNDRWLGGRGDTGAAHAHQIVLEVLTETGVLGFVGLLLALTLAWRHWRSLPVRAKHAVLPFALALGVMVFPINTHLAFYSTFWSLLCWWLVMVYCGFSQTGHRSESLLDA
ncbi:MAG: O-antigen ligase family protein [Lysobacterales bacterium]